MGKSGSKPETRNSSAIQKKIKNPRRLTGVIGYEGIKCHEYHNMIDQLVEMVESNKK